MSVISGGENVEEDHDQVIVDSFERVCEQLGGNIAENAISCQLSLLLKWSSTNISMLMGTMTVHNFNFT